MKGLVLSIILVSGLFFLTQNAFAENLFYGSSSFEKLPSTISDGSSTFELKIRYTEGPYAITKLTPIFDVSPEDAKQYVQIKTESVDGLYRNHVRRIQGTITVDPQIIHEKVFVSVYFNGMDSYGNPYKSAWADSTSINIEKQTRPQLEKNMDYSKFVDFCSKYDPELWDSMSVNERLVSNLCDFRDKGFDEKSWNWLNGTKLDWKNFAQKKAEGYAMSHPLYQEHGVKDSLVVETVVSGRESFPPPMSAIISFDYLSGAEIKQYKKEFMVGISELSERTDNISSLPPTAEDYSLKHGNPPIPSFPPLQQLKRGEDPWCKSDYLLVIKYSNGKPACVKSYTKDQLVERGWTRMAMTKYSDMDLINGAKNTQEVKLFLEKYPKATIEVKPESDSVSFRTTKQVKEPTKFDNGVYSLTLYASKQLSGNWDFGLSCGHKNSIDVFENIIELLNKEWCLTPDLNEKELNGTEPYQREITVLSISPQNVTLPEPKKQTPKTTCTHGACFTPE